MKANGLEPGVLQTFQLFTGVRLALVVLTGILHLAFGEQNGPLSLFYWLGLLEVALLFGYLSMPRLLPGLVQLMKSSYLPVGIIWATLGPLLQPHLAFLLVEGQPAQIANLVSAWQLIPVLFIPLVIISWQFSYRMVVLFCLLTALIDLSPILFFSLRGETYEYAMPVVGVVFIRTVAFLLVGYMILNLVKIQREQRRELTQANRQLTQYAATVEHLTISRERNRLARELHDVLAHTLSGVAVELEAVKALWKAEPEQAQKMLEHSLHDIREGLSETRRALQELRAAPLEDLGLKLALTGLAETMTIRSGIELELRIPDQLGEYPPEVEQAIYRVVQEALTNITNHAGAQRVTVQLSDEQGQLRLAISDDGRGFDPATADQQTQLGLIGMRERVEMIGGRLSVESQPGRGTLISMTYGGAS